MILLLGGTSETAPLAMALAERGFRVLVSTATDVPLDVGAHPLLEKRTGPLDSESMATLAGEKDVQVIVDASHPYASAARANAQEAARRLDIPYLTWVRPAVIHGDDSLHVASDHESAARIACSFGKAVLLTTGARNLVPYAREAKAKGVTLVVRVLPHDSSLEACRKAGIPEKNVITGRGPFSVEENRAAIRKFGIGVIVTKDSGEAGGVPAKIEAAREEGCQVVVVGRPEETAEMTFSDLGALVAAVARLLEA
jgi:precorrin-6A/cobalt-precorrin-6A reductase